MTDLIGLAHKVEHRIWRSIPRITSSAREPFGNTIRLWFEGEDDPIIVDMYPSLYLSHGEWRTHPRLAAAKLLRARWARK